VWTPAHAGEIVYSIQVGAYKELRYALDKIDKLKDGGRHVFYRYENVSNREKLYRVYVEEYKERKGAERKAKELRQQGLIENFMIKKISVGDEVNPPLVIKNIALNQDKGGAEKLLIHSNRFFWPLVRFELEEDIPRLIIHINNATTIEKSLTSPLFHGDLIKKIQNQNQPKQNKVKIVLDLASDKKYEVTQVFDKKDNIFNLAIGLKR
jgi:hypothetical protein